GVSGMAVDIEYSPDRGPLCRRPQVQRSDPCFRVAQVVEEKQGLLRGYDLILGDLGIDAARRLKRGLPRSLSEQKELDRAAPQVTARPRGSLPSKAARLRVDEAQGCLRQLFHADSGATLLIPGGVREELLLLRQSHFCEEEARGARHRLPLP